MEKNNEKFVGMSEDCCMDESIVHLKDVIVSIYSARMDRVNE